MTKLYKSRGILTGSTSRPKHKLPFSKKKSKANGEASEWGMNAVDFYSTQSSITPSMRNEMRTLYKLANGVIDEQDYTFVLNPYGEEQRKRESLQGDPARLRNYDIIGPVVDRIVGDFMVRDTSFQVIATNSDVEDRRQQAIREEIKQGILQQFRNELAAQGIDTGFSNEQANFQVEEILNRVYESPDTMTMQGQNAIDYIVYYNELERKYRMGLGDYVTVGRVFSYRDVFRNDTVFEIVNPMDFDYVASPNEEFVEDGESAVLTMNLSLGETIDFFREDLTDEEIDWLEQEYGGGLSSSRGLSETSSSGDIDNDWRRKDLDTFMQNVFGARRQRSNNTITVKHVVFKSKQEVGKLKVWNMDGSEDYIEVDEDFKPREGEEIEWLWVDQLWEGYLVGNTMYKRVRPVALQRGSIDNPNSCKLPYNGRTFGRRTAIPNTVVKKGKSHQEMYNILKYRMERTIAKNKDKFTVIPLGLVPEKDDMDMYTMMYFADYHGYMFVDETDPKALQALNALKAIDVSMREYVKFLHDICNGIRAEYMEIVGIPRQKMADIKASDDVANTDAAIQQGSLILEDTFVSFEEFMERDYQALLDLSKFAWIDGKKAQFLNTSGELTWLDVDPYMHSTTDYSIFVKGNKAEREKLRQMKALTQAFAQNSATPTMVGRILQANNFDTLMKELERMEKEIQESQAAASQSEQAIKQMEAAEKQADRDYNYYKTDQDNRTKKEIAIINQEGAISTRLLDGSENDEAIARANTALDDIYDRGQKANLEWAKNQAAREKSANDLAIAKENKNQYD